MSAVPVHRAFSAFGIELEYMIVDRRTLAVAPIADTLLRDAAGRVVAEMPRGHLAWSNELVMHVIEVKNLTPDASLDPLAISFQAEVAEINRRLAAEGACLMPGAMHPWMHPPSETRLWPYGNAAIYAALDRILDCRQHGIANLQSMHVNLPFAGNAEFARLHAAVRLLLPILPALAASSPIADGRPAGFLDYRMESYWQSSRKMPTMIGELVPDTLHSRADFAARVLGPMYREIAALDPLGILRHEWLNGRGAIPRFDRKAIEIRVIDMQECPQANLAVAALASAAVRWLYEREYPSLDERQAIATGALANILHACIRDADEAVIDSAEYLRQFGFPGRSGKAGALWMHLVETLLRERAGIDLEPWSGALGTILSQGPLARRILRALGAGASHARLTEVYRQLCDCLAEGRMFLGTDA